MHTYTITQSPHNRYMAAEPSIEKMQIVHVATESEFQESARYV